jgi:hypothetical protein
MMNRQGTNTHALSGIRTHGLSLQTINVYASDRAATGTSMHACIEIDRRFRGVLCRIASSLVTGVCWLVDDYKAKRENTSKKAVMTRIYNRLLANYLPAVTEKNHKSLSPSSPSAVFRNTYLPSATIFDVLDAYRFFTCQRI